MALRNHENIPAETRERVLNAAAQLGYQYAPRTSSRRAESAAPIRSILYVVNDYGDTPHLANPFYGAILNGAVGISQAYNAYVRPAVLQHDHPLDAPLPDALATQPDGIILASPYPPALVARVAASVRCPLVLIDNTVPGSPYDAIMNDDFGGAYQITQHLLQLGHRYIFMIMGQVRKEAGASSVPPSIADRFRGYSTALLDVGQPFFPAVEMPISYELTGPEHKALPQWLASLLSRSPRPTALFCNIDYYAVRIISALTSMGYRVPDDITVVGFDDLDIAQMIHPQLTTVRINRSAISEVAMQRIFARIAGDDSPPLTIHVGARLVVRESSAPMNGYTGG